MHKIFCQLKGFLLCRRNAIGYDYEKYQRFAGVLYYGGGSGHDSFGGDGFGKGDSADIDGNYTSMPYELWMEESNA
jgi:hypothetical protein